MLLLAVIGLFLLLTSLPSTETMAYGVALAGNLVLIRRRSSQLAIPRDLMYLLAFPFLLFVVCLHGIYSHPLSDFLKDCWYFTLPLMYLSFGYLAFERVGQWQKLLQPVMVVGFGLGVYSLVHAVLNRGELAVAASVDAYRAVTGGGTFAPMVPVVLLLMARRTHVPELGLERWSTARLLVYAAGTGAVLVTFSRTHIVTLVLGAVCALNYRTMLRRVLQNGGMGLVVALAVIGAGVYGIAQAKSGPVELFINKVMHSTSEVQVRAYETFEQINNNWRGYEAYRASRTFETYSPVEKVFGGGGGSMVDLGFAMQLSPTESFKYVPLTHNGYMYILIKDGVCGIALFALFMVQLLWMGRQALRLGNPQARCAGLVLLWTPMVMVATQGVITGIYNKGELIPILFLAGAGAASYSQQRQAAEARRHEAPAYAVGMARFGLPRGVAPGEAVS